MSDPSLVKQATPTSTLDRSSDEFRYPARELPVRDIYPSHGWIHLNLRDLWEYRELLYFLTWRDVKVRYKQTVFGVAWVVLQPLIAMVIFSLIFGRLANLPSNGIPYPIFTFTALLPWTLFSGALQRSTTSLVNSSNLITRV